MQAERTAAFDAWYAGRRRSGLRGTDKVRRLAEAGALGVVTSLVPPPGPQGWGVSKISTTVSDTIPEIGLSCEDYGLVYRLAEHDQGPILRVDARSTLGARSAGGQRDRRAARHARSRTSTSCSRRISIRGIPHRARRTTARAPS